MIHSTIVDSINSFFQTTGITIIKIFLVFIIGTLFIRLFIKFLKRMTNKSKYVENTLARFIISILNVFLYIVLLAIMFKIVGLSTTSVVTTLGVFGLGITLALQDTLSSLANGMIIVSTKPFIQGDHVLIDGQEGIIQTISMFNTTIITFDNNVIVIPNKNVISSNIKNFSKMPTKRVDFDINVSYGVNLELVKSTILEVIAKNEFVIKNPEPFVRLTEFLNSSLNIKVRVWTVKDKIWDVKFDLMENVYNAFKEKKIEIPFNQIDVHIKNGEQ